MTSDEYLFNILRREAVDTGPYSPVLAVQALVRPFIQQWASRFLVSMTPSGSFAKGTVNHSGTDIDLFISLSSDTPETLKQIYDSLAQRMTEVGYTPKRQNVSINIRVNGYSVDLVPAKRQDSYSDDHSLYRRKADTWTKTNVTKHISQVRQGNRINESRILKLWRDQSKLDFPSFYLELTVINALSGKQSTLSGNVWSVFHYLRDSFPNARVVDPANTNNIISDELSATERGKIKAAVQRAIAQQYWTNIVT
jgi:hypothetical protein